MKAFIKEEGIVVPLDRANVDTDAILPKQYLKSIRKTGFGEYCFDEWRYLDHDHVLGGKKERKLNRDFVLNYDRYKGASILLTRENFGCGSSREHAPWALIEYGFRAIIAPSFADIFCNNCYKNGLLPVVLEEKIVNKLFTEVEENIGYKLTINLPKQVVITKDNKEFNFEITEYRKNCLLKGLDEIGLTLLHKDKIESFEEKYYQEYPWLIK